ncbi:uncharacterized protein LOC134722308 [Mytilus trossulus]|uniref:uncharacterized protein LOC134722308 n=1 Tax=Mytilus trossulus TaxID=6551 RepID=UPI003006BEC5
MELIGVVTVIGGIVLIAGFDQMNEKIKPSFDKAKDNIRKMIKVINVFPGVEIMHPPNVTHADPLMDIDFKEFVYACGIFLLTVGAVILAISILGFAATYQKSRRLTMTYVVALCILILIQITAVVLYSADRTIANKLIYLHFFKSLDESYRGFQYQDSVGWNLVMQQVKMKQNCTVMSERSQY